MSQKQPSTSDEITISKAEIREERMRIMKLKEQLLSELERADRFYAYLLGELRPAPKVVQIKSPYVGKKVSARPGKQ